MARSVIRSGHGGVLAAVVAAGLAGCAGAPFAPQPEPRAAPAQPVDTPVEVLVQLQELRVEIKSLRNQVEIQGHQMDGLQRRQRELYDDLDRRLRERERAQSAPSAPDMPGMAGQQGGGPIDGSMALEQPAGAAGEASTLGAPQAAAAAEPSAEERAEYETAFNLLKQSRYGAAIAAFRTFLDRFPDSAFAPDAQYWIAEAHYVTRDFATALQEYTRLVQAYPQNRKVPEAMLKMGYCHLELGDAEQGRQLLNEVILRFPGTRVAISAENRLRKPSP